MAYRFTEPGQAYDQIDIIREVQEDDYVIFIQTDEINKNLKRSLSNNDIVAEWYSADIDNIYIRDGKIVVDYNEKNSKVINPEDFIFQYLKTIDKECDGSFTITDSYGKVTTIPVGFPDYATYDLTDHAVILGTKDGQSLKIHLVDALGSYVQCVSENCDGELKFKVVGGTTCDDKEVVIGKDYISGLFPVLNESKLVKDINLVGNNLIVDYTDGTNKTINLGGL